MMPTSDSTLFFAAKDQQREAAGKWLVLIASDPECCLWVSRMRKAGGSLLVALVNGAPAKAFSSVVVLIEMTARNAAALG